MITLKSIFYFLAWYFWVVAIITVGSLLIIETLSSIVGLVTMDKAGLAKDTSKFMWTWIQVKPFIIVPLIFYIAFFTRPDATWVKQIYDSFKGNKKKNAEN